MKTLLLIILLTLFSANLTAQTVTDIDIDDDGLIEIYYLEDLDAVRRQPDGSGLQLSGVEITTGCPTNGCNGYELMRHLDFNNNASYRNASANRNRWTTGSGWQPIGTSSNTFNAIFKGNGYTISNLMINSGIDHIGLFGYVGSGAEISDIGLLNVNVIGTSPSPSYAGGLAGESEGMITASYATGSVTGTSADVGGLVGGNEGGTITNSHATCSVMGTDSNVGGLVGGSAGGTITDNYATGSVTARFSMGGSRAGGLVGGSLGGSIMNNYATGSVIGEFAEVGGLVGGNSGSIMNNYATGSVTGTDSHVGGLVGASGPPTEEFTGSIIITNSYATGPVIGRFFNLGSNVGGLVGLNNSPIMNSYTTGSVTGTRSFVGGLVGNNLSNAISFSYWLRPTGSMLNDIGFGSPLSYTAGQTAGMLRSPMTNNGIYSNWSLSVWDFGTSTQFPTLVDENEAPTLEIIFLSTLTIETGSTANIVILVKDQNFDVNDTVDVTAMSSNQSVVSVMPPEIPDIAANMNITFTLTAGQAGTATITFTATDNEGLAGDDTTLTVSVDAKPTGGIIIGSDSNDKWQLLIETSTVEDANGIAMTSYQWYRNDLIINGANSDTYTIPLSNAARAADTIYRLDVTIVDNIGQEATIQSNVYRVANESPVIESIMAPEMIDEGDTRSIRVNASDANRDRLTYTWDVNSRYTGIVVSGNPATLSIPDYFITDVVSTQTTVKLEVTVSDGIASTTGMVSVIANKRDNGDATLRTSLRIEDSRGTTLTTWTALVASEDPDGGTSGTVVYQWQVCDGDRTGCPPESNWMNIDGAIGTPYVIPGSSVLVRGETFSLVEERSLFRVIGTYTDRQGYREEVFSPSRIYTTRPALMIRAKVFLEGPLQ